MKYSDKQHEAIEINDKHLRIIACAGSGKTTTIAGKVAYLLDPSNGYDVSPENIIAFTYTEKAAAELKSRILSTVGSLKGLASMYVGTIHGWCLKALQENEFEFQKYTVLDEIKLRLFVDKHYEKIGMKEIHKLTNSSVKMQRFVDTGRFIKLMEIIRESQIEDDLPSNIELARSKYENTLRSKNFFDFSMIIDKALEFLKQPNSNLSVNTKNRLKYLIVDEYQDVNSKQEELIYTLQKGSNAKLTVVGDDDQNIYQWRGSNNSYIINFDKKYTPSKTVKLVTNYRSSNGITKIAETLIDNNIERLPKKMDSANTQKFEKGKDIIYNQYENIEEENEAIADFIARLHSREFLDYKGAQKRGLAYSDFCILLRTWKKADGIVEVLEKREIPYITAGVNHLFETAEVKAALSIFEYLNDYISSKQEVKNRWLQLPFKNYDKNKLDDAIDNLENRRPKDRFDSKGEKQKLSDHDFAYNLQDIFWEFLEIAEIFEDTYIDNKTQDTEKRTKEIAEIIFFNLGKFSQVIKDFEEVNFNSGSGRFHLFNFLSFINHAAQEYYPEGWISNPYKTPNAVQIMTIHQAKGLEFPVVFVPGLNRNYLPQKKKGGLNEWHFLDANLIKDQYRYLGNIEDERRLLYVALTRAQKFLLLSRAPDANNRLYQYESPFVSELDASGILFQNKNETFNYLSKELSNPLDKVRSITLNFSILKDFFDCPYRFKLISMYGFSFPLNQRMGLGRSFHNALMELHKRAQKGEDFNEGKLNDIANRQMHFPYIANADKLKPFFEDMIRDNLKSYYDENVQKLEHIAFVEQDIELKLEDEILITGRIDLIRREKDEGGYETTIIEFKSDEETPHSAKVNEDQLKLYALGHLELTGEMANYIMTYIIGGKDPKGHVRHIITQEDLQYIQNKINNAAKKIRNQDFIRTSSQDICKECYHSSLCPNRVILGIKSMRK